MVYVIVLIIIKGIWVNIYICMYMNFMCGYMKKLNLEKIINVFLIFFVYIYKLYDRYKYICIF